MRLCDYCHFPWEHHTARMKSEHDDLWIRNGPLPWPGKVNTSIPPPAPDPEEEAAICRSKNKWRKWTEEEERSLLELFMRGVSWEKIAKTLNRSLNACQYRAGLLGADWKDRGRADDIGSILTNHE